MKHLISRISELESQQVIRSHWPQLMTPPMSQEASCEGCLGHLSLATAARVSKFSDAGLYRSTPWSC